MKAFLWRVLYALICVFIFLWIFPLFCTAVGFPLTGALGGLLKPLVACLAVLYVLFGPPPSAPW